MKTKNKCIAASLMLCVFLCGCYNPFFPPTGEPLKGDIARSTPAGTVMQIFRAYETRQINLFMDLFSPSKDFRFYVSPGFQPDFSGKPVTNIETIDSVFEYVWKKGIRHANYWTYDEEIQIHNNLFTQAVEISLTENPLPIDTNSIVYMTGPDGTRYAEVVLMGGKFDIRVKTEYEQIISEYTVDIVEQVFYLEKDPINPSLWVIAKWFDLGAP